VDRGLATEIRLPNTENIDNNRSGFENNWSIIILAKDEGCGLIAEELEDERYKGFFTANRNIVNRCIGVLNSLILIQEVDI
jgi:hypothetical protein